MVDKGCADNACTSPYDRGQDRTGVRSRNATGHQQSDGASEIRFPSLIASLLKISSLILRFLSNEVSVPDIRASWNYLILMLLCE